MVFAANLVVPVEISQIKRRPSNNRSSPDPGDRGNVVRAAVMGRAAVRILLPKPVIPVATLRSWPGNDGRSAPARTAPAIPTAARASATKAAVAAAIAAPAAAAATAGTATPSSVASTGVASTGASATRVAAAVTAAPAKVAIALLAIARIAVATAIVAAPALESETTGDRWARAVPSTETASVPTRRTRAGPTQTSAGCDATASIGTASGGTSAATARWSARQSSA